MFTFDLLIFLSLCTLNSTINIHGEDHHSFRNPALEAAQVALHAEVYHHLVPPDHHLVIKQYKQDTLEHNMAVADEHVDHKAPLSTEDLVRHLMNYCNERTEEAVKKMTKSVLLEIKSEREQTNGKIVDNLTEVINCFNSAYTERITSLEGRLLQEPSSHNYNSDPQSSFSVNSPVSSHTSSASQEQFTSTRSQLCGQDDALQSHQTSLAQETSFITEIGGASRTLGFNSSFVSE
jgi:hypothetical protein